MAKKFLYGFFVLILFLGGAIFFIQNTRTSQIKESEIAERIPMISDQEMGENTYSISMSDNIFKETFIDPFIKNQYFEGVFRDSAVLGSQEPETSLLLSEKEIFSRIWPNFYIDYLWTMEGVMRDFGFIRESETFSFHSDDDIYAFLLLIVDFMEHEQFIDSRTAIDFRSGILEVLAPLIAAEKNALRGGKESSTDYFPTGAKIDFFKDKNISRRELFMGFAESLKYIITFSKPAHAQFGGFFNPASNFDPTGSTDCYKDQNPFFLVPGVNLWNGCCNCGLNCSTGGCVFMPSCGPTGTAFFSACDVPLGCLNLTCAGFPNAIWNPLLGICGCG